WSQPAGEGGFEEVLRKSAELEKIAMAERKAKKSKCPPIGKTEEAEPVAKPTLAARQPKPPGKSLDAKKILPCADLNDKMPMGGSEPACAWR
ncbi:MAG: hypothetical protein LBU23_12325, partial [Planctomycetota bacterium]|nr:hypothetical protein [Planctomycetota bacterium]